MMRNLLFNLFLLMVFCNKCPLSILTQVFVSYFCFLTSEIGKFDNPNIKLQISLNVLYKYLRVYYSLEFFSFKYANVRSITAMSYFLSIMQSYGLLQPWVLFFQLCYRTVYYTRVLFRTIWTKTKCTWFRFNYHCEMNMTPG